MSLEVILGIGLLATLLVVGLTIVGLISSRRFEAAARESHAVTVARGALPPSLHPRIKEDVCIGSGTCVDVCPEYDVLAVLDGKAKIVNPTACIGHGECMRACPVDAIELVLGNEKRGVTIPLVDTNFQSNVEGIYIVGELGGMGLVYNAMTQAMQCVAAIKKAKPPKVDGVHQVLVVGSGPAGIAASVTAMDAKLDFLTVDQESTIGGTVAHYPRHKVVMTKSVKLPIYGNIKVAEIKKEALLEIWEDIVAKTGLEVQLNTKVEGIEKGEDGVFTVKTTQGDIRTQTVILAMGRRGSPRKLRIPGEDLPKVIYRLIEAENYIGRKVMVVGGGDSAVEAVIALGEAGAEAKLCYRKASFDRIKPKNQKRLDKAVEKGQVELVLKANPKAITADTIDIEVDGEMTTFPNDDVIVAIGGVLPTKFLQAAGVEIKEFKGEAFAPANT